MKPGFLSICHGGLDPQSMPPNPTDFTHHIYGQYLSARAWIPGQARDDSAGENKLCLVITPLGEPGPALGHCGLDPQSMPPNPADFTHDIYGQHLSARAWIPGQARDDSAGENKRCFVITPPGQLTPARSHSGLDPQSMPPNPNDFTHKIHGQRLSARAWIPGQARDDSAGENKRCLVITPPGQPNPALGHCGLDPQSMPPNPTDFAHHIYGHRLSARAWIPGQARDDSAGENKRCLVITPPGRPTPARSHCGLDPQSMPPNPANSAHKYRPT